MKRGKYLTRFATGLSILSLGALLTTLSLGALLPMAAFAAEGEGHGDPWLDLVFKAVNLAVLLGILIYFLRRPVSTFLRGSASKSKQSLDDIRREAQETEKRLTDNKRNLEGLQRELNSMKDDARKETDTEKERLVAEARALAERFQSQVNLQVEQARNQAVATMRAELAEEIIGLAETGIKKKMDDKRQSGLVKEHIDSLGAG